MTHIVDDIIAVKRISDEIEGLSDSDARLLCWMLAAEINEREERANEKNRIQLTKK